MAIVICGQVSCLSEMAKHPRMKFDDSKDDNNSCRGFGELCCWNLGVEWSLLQCQVVNIGVARTDWMGVF